MSAPAEALLARAKAVANPFAADRVDSAWDVAPDASAINRTAFERCLESIDLVRRTGQSRGLLLSGEPGSGKTHLLQRLRLEIQRSERDCFVYVPPVSAPDRFFRDLLQRTFRDLVRSGPGGEPSQIETILIRELVRAETRARVTTAGLWADVRRRNPPGEQLFAWLETPMQTLCMRLELDPDVVMALRHYLASLYRFDAYAWLHGQSIAEERLSRIGVSRTLEDDADAFHAFVTLSRLAGGASVLILAFDQLEGLQVGREDSDALRAYAGGIVRLFVDCRNIAAISCVQTYFKQDLERLVPKAHMHRLAQDQGALTLLQSSTAAELVQHRLAAQIELQDVRQHLGEQNALWPLSREAIEQQIPTGGIAARPLLWLCRGLFEAWQRGVGPQQSSKDGLIELWDRRVGEEVDSPPDEGVYADGLLKLLDARVPGGAKRSTLRDIDVLLPSKDGDTGIAICHTENMTSLAARLKRLLDAADKKQVRRLVVLRDERLPISQSARTTRQRMDALKERGHRLLRPPAEAYAAVAAARKLLAEAAAGDLSIEDRAMSIEDLKAWLAGHLTRPLVDLLDDLQQEHGAETDELLERLHEMLEGTWVVTVNQAAQRVGRTEKDIVAHLIRPQRIIGLLSGPPALLFLSPEGIKRD